MKSIPSPSGSLLPSANGRPALAAGFIAAKVSYATAAEVARIPLRSSSGDPSPPLVLSLFNNVMERYRIAEEFNTS